MIMRATVEQDACMSDVTIERRSAYSRTRLRPTLSANTGDAISAKSAVDDATMHLTRDVRTRLGSEMPMETREGKVTPVSSTTLGRVSHAHNGVTMSHLLRSDAKVRARTNVPGFVSRPFLFLIVKGGSSIMSGTWAESRAVRTGRAELLRPYVRRRRTRFPVAKSLSVFFSMARRKENSKTSVSYKAEELPVY